MNLHAGEKSPASVSLLVTGGYHGPGLTEKLTRAGMAVVTVVPKIQKVDTAQGSSYLSVFAQEKTPLSKLFEGSKLFVADSPLSPENAAFQAVGAAAASTQPGTPFPQKVLAFLETHFDGVTVRWTNGVAHIRLHVTGKEFLVRYDPSQPAKKITPDDPSAGSLLPEWIQNLRSRAADGRLFITGTALAIAGVWFFFTGTGLVEKIGPFLTMIGTITILQAWTTGTGGKSLVANGSMAPLSSQTAPVNQPMAMMEAESTSIGQGVKDERTETYKNLSSIPNELLSRRLVIVRTTQDAAGAKTINGLVQSGARVVLLTRGNSTKNS
ncbi:MAG: hypothetical protein IPN90_07870 [Elusimicrobia bacterium]|nr:hypothetical protein [Elusimicrobiota bacterium]